MGAFLQAIMDRYTTHLKTGSKRNIGVKKLGDEL